MEMAEWMHETAISQMKEFDQTGEMAYLEAAITFAQESVDETNESNEHLGERLNCLGSVIAARYQHIGGIGELELAISYAQRAVALGGGNLAARLNNLANMEGLRYETTRDTVDLESAIRNARRAVDITTDNDEDLSQWLYNLGYKIFYQYELTGSMKLLEEACSIEQRAVELTPDNDPSLPGKLGALGQLLSARCKRTGKTNDLNEAVETARRAVNLMSDGHPNKAYVLHFLADNLCTRSKMTGRGEDMWEADTMIKHAIRIVADRHVLQSSLLNSFASIQSHFYKRIGDIKYLDESIASIRKAISISPDSDDLTLLNNLSLYLRHQYEHTKKPKDLEEAVVYARKVANSTPDHDPRLATRLSNLSARLFQQHELTGAVEPLEESITIGQRAVNFLPDDHPDLAQALNDLSYLLLCRYKLANKLSDRDAAVCCSLRAFNVDSGRPIFRISAVRRAIRLLLEQNNLPKASLLADKAVELLPLLCGRYLRPKDQLRAIQQTSGLASDACSLILRTGGDLNRALEYLEHGCALVMGYLIDNHGDLSELRKVDDEKADEFSRLTRKAFMPVDMEANSNLRNIFLQYQDREEARKDLERCLKDIRQLDGQGQFLLPVKAADMRKHATEGPIVMVNISDIGSDALVVSLSGVRAVALPNINTSSVKSYRPWSLTRDTKRHVYEEEPENDERFRQFLLRLWFDCVRPVLQELGYYKVSRGAELPRIWWIGTGFASSLPFHAAGDQSIGSIENTLSWVISSYTPTIKALAYARAKDVATIDKNSVLLVTMPETPGGDRLPGVKVEEVAIRDAIKALYPVKTLCQPGVDIVMEELRQFGIAHFACHGLGDKIDPSKSYLALQGSSDSVSDKLTVQKMINADLGGAWLAYLSACSTAEIKNENFGDEALHLASSFQVAGFRHTVASMWPSSDVICAQVAGLFYRNLMEKGGIGGGDRNVATALHIAVREISSQNSKKPSLWAQYIHSGA